MIVVKVEYTVNDDYVNTNREMIYTFLTDFKKLDHTQVLYTIFQTADSNTFIHISQYKNKKIQDVLLHTPSFLRFQEERDKNLASKPKIEVLTPFGNSKSSAAHYPL